MQRRGVRRFIHDPGLLEVRLRDGLRRLGLESELWPGSDSYDLRIRFDDGEVWGIDAKDWESAGLLARAFSWNPDPPCDRAFLVVAQHRCRGTQYLRELETELEGRVSGVEVWSEDRFLTHAIAERIGRGRGGR